MNENPLYDLTARMDKVMQAKRNEALAFHAYLETQPAVIQCDKHPGERRRLDKALSEAATIRAKYRPTAAYELCPICAQGTVEQEIRDRLARQGVPPLLLHCSLENYRAENEAEADNLRAVKEFAAWQRGFLVMLGKVGNGKTHLAIGVQRQCKGAVFIQQSKLLSELRNSYHDRQVENPTERCQKARLLILDEVGVSGGGRDEYPMLHAILDHRYTHQLPTILTGNLNLDEFRQLLGERLTDRVREAASAILTFSGRSRRADNRAQYLDQEPML